MSKFKFFKSKFDLFGFRGRNIQLLGKQIL